VQLTKAAVDKRAVHMCVKICGYIYINIYIYTCVYMYIYLYVCIDIHIFTYRYMYVHMQGYLNEVARLESLLRMSHVTYEAYHIQRSIGTHE